MEAGYLAAFTTGLIGGFGHCAGMCGPIIISCTLQDTSSLVNRLISGALYNTGRIATYMFIGALTGLMGSFVNIAGKIAGFRHAVALMAGLFMILLGLNMCGLLKKTAWPEGRSGVLARAGASIVMEKSRWKYFPLGALFGFVPCGLSYSIFVASAGTGGFLPGMLVSLFFGLGTLPSLMLVNAAAAYMGGRLRGMLYKIAGGMVIIAGILFFIKGMQRYAVM